MRFARLREKEKKLIVMAIPEPLTLRRVRLHISVLKI